MNANNITNKKSVVTIKVTPSEKEELQTMADKSNLSLSEFVRLKSLSKINKAINQENRIKELEEELNRVKVTLSYFNEDEQETSGIILPVNSKQKEILLALFDNFYKDGKSIESQILRYLAEDLITTHYDLIPIQLIQPDKTTIEAFRFTTRQLSTNKGLGPVKFFEAFREIGLDCYRSYNQLKAIDK
jgi:uncharacterized protein (DUF1778 family)